MIFISQNGRKRVEEKSIRNKDFSARVRKIAYFGINYRILHSGNRRVWEGSRAFFLHLSKEQTESGDLFVVRGNQVWLSRVMVS